MNQILQWLTGGDLRSDGLSNQVVSVVLQQPHLFEDLMEGLDSREDIIRGRTADALEKIARTRPDLLQEHIQRLVALARAEHVPMVKMHLAMIFGHLSIYKEHADDLVSTLFALLADASVFTVSWVIVSLCILARKYPEKNDQILNRIAPLKRHDSIAIRSKAGKAIKLLTQADAQFPQGWLKSSL